MLKKKIVAALSWLRDNVVAVLLVSFVIPGVLAVFNQQSAITRAIFETDYKAAKLKFQECHRFHAEYITSVRSNQGAALLMHKHFNINEVFRRGGLSGLLRSLQGDSGNLSKFSRKDGGLIL